VGFSGFQWGSVVLVKYFPLQLEEGLIVQLNNSHGWRRNGILAGSSPANCKKEKSTSYSAVVAKLCVEYLGEF